MLPCPVRIFRAFYVCVYRGVTSYNAENVEVLSWTLNREAAEWFAHRRGENGAVYEAQVEKGNIYAVFLGRNEEEVLADPGRRRELTQLPEPEQGTIYPCRCRKKQ